MCQLTCNKRWTPTLIEIDKITHIKTCTHIIHISKYTPMQNVGIQVHTHKNINHNKTWGQINIFLVFHGPLCGLESQKHFIFRDAQPFFFPFFLVMIPMRCEGKKIILANTLCWLKPLVIMLLRHYLTLNM
jgi:hypothetical protein